MAPKTETWEIGNDASTTRSAETSTLPDFMQRGEASQSGAQHHGEHAMASEMAELPAREKGSVASEGNDKENAPDNGDIRKRARKQQTLDNLLKCAAAAKTDFTSELDKTPDHLPSHEVSHPKASGGGWCAEWCDRARGNYVDEEAVIAELTEQSATIGVIIGAEEEEEADAEPEESELEDVQAAGGDTDVEEGGGEAEEDARSVAETVPEAEGEEPLDEEMEAAEEPLDVEMQGEELSESEEMEAEEMQAGDSRMDIDLSGRPANPLAEHATFLSHMPTVKKNPAQRDDVGNPKTLFEAAHDVLERLGHRFVVLNDDAKPTMWVCDAVTNVWSCKPCAISNFMKEACDEVFYYTDSKGDGEGERKLKYLVTSPTHRKTVQEELLNFCTVCPLAWNDMIDRVPRGCVACADGFLDFNEQECRAYEPSDLMTTGGIDNAFKLPFSRNDGEMAWNLSADRVEELHNELKVRMNEIMPDDVMQITIIGYMGTALFNYGKSRKFLVLTGAGSNGKSALLELFGLILAKTVKLFGGSTDCPFLANSRSDTKTANSPMIACKGKLIVATLDCPDDRFIDSGLLKNVTGDASIDARELYKANETIRTDFITIFASNHMLKFTVNDKAIADRIVAFQMPSRFILKENATDEELEKIDATKLALEDSSLANPHHYLAEPGWQNKFKSPEGKLALYAFIMQKYQEFKDLAESSTSGYDMSQQYKSQASVAPEITAFITPTKESNKVSKAQVAIDFNKAMHKIIFITGNKADTVSYAGIYNALEELGVPKTVSGKAAKCLSRNLLPWVEETEGVEVAAGKVKGKKVLAGAKLKYECLTNAPPPGYVNSPDASFCGSPPTTPVPRD